MKQKVFRQNMTGYASPKKALPLDRGIITKHYLKKDFKIH